MERLVLGPDACLADNPRLVYGRMTGWGQDGPLAQAAGHDGNYISLSGAQWLMGEAGRDPMPPLNLVGDFGGGGMLLAFGIACALVRARETGRGDVVDAAICDGTAALMAPLYASLAQGAWVNERGANRLDGSAPYYGVYRCKDDRWISLAPIEPQFWALFLDLLGLPAAEFADREDRTRWAGWRDRFARIFAERTREEWRELFEGTDVCFAPVLDMQEAPLHPHNLARGVFQERGGVMQPAPAPRFREAEAGWPAVPGTDGTDAVAALRACGFSENEIAALTAEGTA